MVSFSEISLLVALVSQLGVAHVADSMVAHGELLDALVTDDECCAKPGEAACALGLAQLRAAGVRVDGSSSSSPNMEPKMQPKAKTKVHHAKHTQEANHKQEAKHRQEAKHKQEAKQEEKIELKQKVEDKQEANHQQEAKQQVEHKEMAKSEALPDYQHPAWVKDCQKIFLDLGSHIGVNVRKFYEPKRYPGAKLLHFFEESIGSSAWRRVQGNKTGVCVLGFEPNPKHSPRLQRLEEAYVEQGWYVHFYPLAAWSSEGHIALSDTESDSPGVVANQSSEGDGETVRTADLAKFIQTLPPNSVKLMVMDIDGAEYETLARLMQQSVLCNSTIERALVGAHAYGEVKHWGTQDSFLHGTDPRSFAAITERVEQLAGVKWCADDTVTQVEEFDDDTYTQDVDDAFGKSPDEIKRLARKDKKPPLAFMAEVGDEKYPERELVIQIGEPSDEY